MLDLERGIDMQIVSLNAPPPPSSINSWLTSLLAPQYMGVYTYVALFDRCCPSLTLFAELFTTSVPLKKPSDWQSPMALRSGRVTTEEV